MFGTNLYWHPFWMHVGYGMGRLDRQNAHLSISVDSSGDEALANAQPHLEPMDTRGKLLPIALQGLQRTSSAKKLRVLISVSGVRSSLDAPSLARAHA